MEVYGYIVYDEKITRICGSSMLIHHVGIDEDCFLMQIQDMLVVLSITCLMYFNVNFYKPLMGYQSDQSFTHMSRFGNVVICCHHVFFRRALAMEVLMRKHV